jgi:hypothetical protein
LLKSILIHRILINTIDEHTLKSFVFIDHLPKAICEVFTPHSFVVRFIIPYASTISMQGIIFELSFLHLSKIILSSYAKWNIILCLTFKFHQIGLNFNNRNCWINNKQIKIICSCIIKCFCLKPCISDALLKVSELIFIHIFFEDLLEVIFQKSCLVVSKIDIVSKIS